MVRIKRLLYRLILSDNERTAIKIGYVTIKEYSSNRKFRRSILGQLVTEIIKVNENRKSQH